MTTLAFNLSPASQATSGHDGVDLWLCACDGMDHLDRQACLAMLDPQEHAQWHRYVCPSAKDQYLVARALSRSLLANVHGCTTGALRFGKSAYGRPYVALPQVAGAAHFNLAHTDGLVVMALASSAEIGVDVEHVERAWDWASLSSSCFHPHERTQVLERDASHSCEAFFQTWTLKEAYAKARGLGLQLPLNSYAFHLGGHGIGLTCEPPCGDDPQGWFFHSFKPSARYRVAVAVRGKRASSALRVHHIRAGAQLVGSLVAH